MPFNCLDCEGPIQRGPAYAYGPSSTAFYAEQGHWKCEKHHSKAERARKKAERLSTPAPRRTAVQVLD